MKKRYKIPALLPAALLLLLAACGGEPSAPADQPDPEPSALPAPYYLAFAPGETAEGDLDGDGRAEEIRVWLEDGENYGDDLHLTVNGEDLSEAIREARGGFDCPDGERWLLTDLDTGDGQLEIAIQDWGPSDDLTTSFYHYAPGSVILVGAVEGFVCFGDEAGDISFDGQGAVHSYLRFDVLQTWWGKAESALDEDGRLVLLPQDYYETVSPRFLGAAVSQPVTLNCSLSAFDAPDGSRDLLPAGTELELLGTDNAEWVRARKTDDGQELWLHLDPEYPVRAEGPQGFIEGWEAMDGLIFAD